MPVLGCAAWLGGIAATRAGDLAGVVLVALLVVAGALAWTGRAGRASPGRRLVLTSVVVGAAVLSGALLRLEAVATSPLTAWAADRATADLVGTVMSDPRRVEGQWGDRVVVRLRVEEATARGERRRLGGSVVVLGDPVWAGVELGERVLAEGRLAPSDSPQVGALLLSGRSPVRIRGPDPWWRAAGAVRAAIRDSVAHRPPAQAGLVPALVVGDDAGLPAEVEADFRTTGLTHDEPH